MKISEAKNKLKVGDWVRTNGSDVYRRDEYFEGEIGEIQGDTFYVWQNERIGGKGVIDPETKGYKFSWVINWDNSIAEIEILKSSSKNIMSNLNLMQKKHLSADLKKMIEADLISRDLELTGEGLKALETIMFGEKIKEMVVIANEILKERSK